MTRPVALDVTELVGNPFRTGVQRVTREIWRRWPGPRPLVPVTLDTKRGEILRLPGRGIRRVERLFEQEELRTGPLRAVRHLGRRVAPGSLAGLLNTEVYHDVARSRLYEDLGLRLPVLAVGYDFLPQLAPEHFDYGAVTNTMWYVRWMRSVHHIAFISEQSRRDFVTRIDRRRCNTWKVFAPGADGLGIAEPSFEPSRKGFVCLGTIEARKNHESVLDAFERLWDEGLRVDLTFVGRARSSAEGCLSRITEAQTNRPFRWVQQASDAQIRELIRRSRATILASKAEGYGLPAVESLALGVPVIVTDSLPSVETLPPAGQVRLAQVDPDSIAAGVRELLDDDRAREKTMEIPTLSLPTWRGFVASISAWVHGVVREAT